jgi:CRISPR system Cascade subunit CasE
MYFTRLSFNTTLAPQRLAQTLVQDVYREHQALWTLFDSDPDAERDFLYRQVIENGHVKYYVVSQRVPVDTSGIWSIDPPKPYNPQLRAGERLVFSLRANPVITVTSPEGKRQRHDVVMHEKRQLNYERLPPREKPPMQQLIQRSCLRWLESRQAAHGFEVLPNQVTVEAYQQHLSHSKRSGQPVRFSSVDFQGVLTIKEVDVFRQTLFQGLGKSKTFGCGLLLIRRY